MLKNGKVSATWMFVGQPPFTASNTVVEITLKGMRFGDYLVFSPNGKVLTFRMSEEQAHNIATIINGRATDRAFSGIFPFEEMFCFLTLDGTRTIGADIAPKLLIALVGAITERGLSIDLWNLDPKNDQ